MMCKNPAEALRLKSKGVLSVGMDADIVIFDGDVNVKSVIVMGQRVV
jgi:N-acetylglucosamine-6-phosphate deacetylase